MNLDRIVESIDPQRAEPSLDGGARELCAEIMTVPREAAERPAGRRRLPLLARRRWLGAPLAAAVAAAVVMSWLLPGDLGIGPRRAAAALDIQRQGGFYIVRVTDLYSDPARYRDELRKRDLNISLRVVPVRTPSEGRPFVYDQAGSGLTDAAARLSKDLITTIDRPGPCAAASGCPIGLRIPVGYQGSATIYLGRQARPGEAYQDPITLDAPGAPLHCVAFRLLTVDRVRALLRRHGVPYVSVTGGGGVLTSVPGSWYVHDGVLSGPGRALLLVAPTRKTPRVPGPVASGQPWRKGC